MSPYCSPQNQAPNWCHEAEELVCNWNSSNPFCERKKMQDVKTNMSAGEKYCRPSYSVKV